MSRIFITIVSILLSNFAVVFADTEQLTNTEQVARYQQLTKKIRCLVCPNQTIFDSNEFVAIDLRKKIKSMIENGASDQQIIDDIVNRYGDYILYQPPLKPSTFALWITPFLILLGCVIFFITRIYYPKSKL